MGRYARLSMPSNISINIMPRLHTHTLSDGLTIHIQLKRSAKKNLILRPVSPDTVSINIPPFVTQRTFTPVSYTHLTLPTTPYV